MGVRLVKETELGGGIIMCRLAQEPNSPVVQQCFAIDAGPAKIAVRELIEAILRARFHVIATIADLTPDLVVR